MPVKKSKSRTPQELEEMLEAFQSELYCLAHCGCLKCEITHSMHSCCIDTLLYALGRSPKAFNKMVGAMKIRHAGKTSHHFSHAE
jgi:hypothetical protein